MSLSSIIVQRGIATIREVEEALARQVLYGGDLATNLLEVCRIEEAALVPTMAESFHILPGPAGELPRATEEAQRLVAGEVAYERRFAPLAVQGDALVVAVAEPLPREVEQELTFALAMPLEQRFAPLFRIQQALARDFGIPMEPRMVRLLTKIADGRARVTSSFPPPGGAGAPFPLKLPAKAPSVAPGPPRAIASEAAPRTAASAEGPSSGAERGTFVRRTEAPAQRPVRRRRGPLTIEVAKSELEETSDRDTIFDILFEFARQFFDYTALFFVQGDLAEGRDAFGDGASREKVARIGVPLDLRNMLSSARERKATVRAVPASDGLDPVLVADLGREGKTECVVVPVVVRTRVVALLFGDGGETGLDDKGISEVESVVYAAVAAVERLIVRKKLKGSEAPGGPTKPPRASAAPPNTTSSPAAAAVRPRPSERPAVEELAAPIRELMSEPMSRGPAHTSREPTAEAIFPPEDPDGRSDLPPPANLLAVRRPSGAPIPREEPEQREEGAPATFASAEPPPASGRPKSIPHRRGQAPPLEFGRGVPSTSGFADTPFGVDETERALLAQIEGRSAPPPDESSSARPESAPTTQRDPRPPIITSPPAAPSSPPGAPSEAPSAAPQSPKAESPPPMRVASITDVSPTGPILPLVAPPPDLAEAVQMAEPAEAPTPVAPPVWTSDPDATPLVPPVVESAAEPPARPEKKHHDTDPMMRPPEVAPPSPQRKPALQIVSFGEAKPMPPSEQQVSVPAHKPPSSRSDYERILPSVIVDVSSEYVGLVDRVIEGDDEEAEASLLRAGGYAMPAIMAKFPGPITVDKERLASLALPRVGECGPVVRLVASQRRTALPFVLAHVEDGDTERRFWATFLLTELVYPDAIDSAIGRVFDDAGKVRRVARAAVRALAEVSPGPVIERLGAAAREVTAPRSRRVLAIEALGETREPLAVPALLDVLEDAADDVAAAVRAALVTITRQDFGMDVRRWSEWWEANKDRHRIEWLIDALMHDQAALRAVASEELKTITKEYFGYYDDLPKRERERAQARFREWWTSIGRVRFSRASQRGQ